MKRQLTSSALVASAVAAALLGTLLAVPRVGQRPDADDAADALVEVHLLEPRLDGDVLRLVTEPPSLERLLAEDRLAPRDAPLRVAVPASARVDLLSAPPRATPRGRVHRIEVRSPGATSLSVAFETFRLPAAAELRVAGERTTLGPYTARDATLGELWTPAVPGEHLAIELHVPHTAAFSPDVVLTRIHHGYRTFGEARAEAARAADTCHTDAACSDDEALAGPVRSVAVYTVQGTHTCTGQLLESATPEPTPYFLTADHCGVTPTNAHTVSLYWNVVSPACGARCCGDLSLSQSGAVVRARHAATDMCLLELFAPPPAAASAYLSGWDARDEVLPGRTTAIHHPRGTEKAISVNEDPVTVASYLSSGPGDGTHLRVGDWEIGTTEPGSSGSGLWDEAGRLVGQLHGGHAACGVALPDWYGRLARSWEGGGTRATRLRDWLDPMGVTGRVRGGRSLGAPPAVPPPVVGVAGRLLPPAPNPTAGGMTVRWEIDAPGRVEVSVVDVHGRHVATLADADGTPGAFSRRWDGMLATGLRAPAGVYFVRLAHEGRTLAGAKIIVRR